MHLFFICLTFVSVLVAFCFGLAAFKHHNSTFRIIFIQLAVALTTESCGSYLFINNQVNTWVFNLYLIPSTLLLGIAGIRLFATSIAKKIGYIIFALWLVGASVYFSAAGLQSFASKLFLSSSALLIITYFYALFTVFFTTPRNTYFNPTFLLCIAILLYYGCNIPNVGLLDYLMKTDMNMARTLYRINLIMCDVQYFIISLCYYRLISQKLSPGAAPQQTTIEANITQ